MKNDPPSPSKSALPLSAIRKIASLSKLECNEEELNQFQKELSGIISHLQRLNKINTKNIDPLCHPLDVSNRLDCDETKNSLSIETIIKNAPKSERNFIEIPNIRETS